MVKKAEVGVGKLATVGGLVLAGALALESVKMTRGFGDGLWPTVLGEEETRVEEFSRTMEFSRESEKQQNEERREDRGEETKKWEDARG